MTTIKFKREKVECMGFNDKLIELKNNGYEFHGILEIEEYDETWDDILNNEYIVFSKTEKDLEEMGCTQIEGMGDVEIEF